MEKEFNKMDTDLKAYTVTEISKLTGICTKTLRKYIAEGRLKAVKFGRVWRVKESDYKDFLEGK